MARLYSNENFPLPVVEELRRLGHDVLTIQEAGKANQECPDEAVLASASADDRALLTINRKHFIRLHRAICTEPLRLDTFLAIFSSNRGPGLAPSATVPRIRPG